MQSPSLRADTLLQNMKDSLVVTNAGAEVLPFLGAYAVLPGSILFYMYHERLVRRREGSGVEALETSVSQGSMRCQTAARKSEGPGDGCGHAWAALCA